MDSSVSANSSEAQNAGSTLNGLPTKTNGSGEQARVGVVRYDEYFSQRTFCREYKKTKKGGQANKVYRKRPVLVVRRLIDHRGQLEKTVVDVMSPALQKILKSMHGTHVDISDVKPEISSQVLFHFRRHFKEKLIEAQSNDKSNESLIFELQTMVNVIEEEWGPTASHVEGLISEGQITFDLLWTLFPPGCLVYRRHPLLDRHQVMRYREARLTIDQGVRYFSISCDIISNDGNHLGLARVQDSIKVFSNTARIQDLDFLPLRYHPDHETIYEVVVKRGFDFSQLKKKLFETNGRAFEESQQKLKIFMGKGRVMIDFETFRIFQPNNIINLPVHRRLENQDNLSEDDRSICSPVVIGFCFGTKTWGGFAMENLKPVKWSDTAFHSLVLENENKMVVRALIKQHSNGNGGFDDVISGKGKGMVGLLCGKPGTGKTLTAEAVAEEVKKPLYVVSAGDLGTSAPDIDGRLLEIFELAAIWNAVVLLDEADVFLHKRTPLALDQNALVAVFLRHLEYYQGALIMTTNMNEDFDPAFESRIHFSIRYPDLDHNSRKIIWRTFVERALKPPNQIGFDEKQYNHLAKFKLNGRQIKNTVSVASSLAADSDVPLAIRHIEVVLNSKAHWDKELPPTRTLQRERVVPFLMLLFIGAAVFLGLSIWYAPRVGDRCME